MHPASKTKKYYFLFQVVETDVTSVKIVWLEPLGTDASCDSDDAFYQYAETATSSHNGVRWSPNEATGKL